MARRLLAAALLLLALGGRFYSTEIRLADEPTVMLALRSMPGWSNVLRVANHGVPAGHVVLLTDENGYPGDALYDGFVSWGWLALGVAGIALAARDLRRRPHRG